jgi:hypothetical protein
MAFSSTLTLPHADGNIVCTKINQDGYCSEYLARTSVHEYRVKIRHTTRKVDNVTVDRHNVEIVQTVFAAGEVAEYTRKVYIVLEQQPKDTDVKNTDALADWLIATANVNVTSLLNWES